MANWSRWFLLLAAASAQAEDKPPACNYVMTGKLQIRYTGADLQPAVNGAINGTPAVMLLDTGAHRSYLTRTGTSKRGLTLSESGSRAYGVGGMTPVYWVPLTDFAVGPAHGGKMLLPVIGEMANPPSYDAIVGADFLLQTDFEIALTEKEIRFFRPNSCNDNFLGYWSQDASQVPFVSGSGTTLNPYFMVELNGKRMRAMIDSGASRSTVELKAAKWAGVNPGNPRVTRVGNFSGAGGKLAPRWNALFDSFTIGGETIRHAAIDIIGTTEISDDNAPDVILGQDFLRVHRVLFAMSQQRLYLSYLGGEVFAARRAAAEPWIVAEAEAGNADAQYALGIVYLNGNSVVRDEAQAMRWLRRAASQGHARANAAIGRDLLKTGRYAEAAMHLRHAIDTTLADRYTSLWLYLARLQNGERELAQHELEAEAVAGNRNWPAPIAAFYLGRIDAEALLAQAAKEADQAALRSCEASGFIAELRAARGGDTDAPASAESACADLD